MNELKIIDDRVSSIDLHAKLGIKDRHRRWIVNILKYYDFTEGEDYVIVDTITESGQHSKDYLLTKDTAKEICLVSRTPMGKLYRNYLIQLDKIADEQAKELEDKIAIIERMNALQNSYCLSDVCCKFVNCSPIDISHDLYMDNYTDYRLNGKFPTEFAPDDMISVTDKYGRAYVRFNKLHWIMEYIKSKGYELK